MICTPSKMRMATFCLGFVASCACACVCTLDASRDPNRINAAAAKVLFMAQSPSEKFHLERGPQFMRTLSKGARLFREPTRKCGRRRLSRGQLRGRNDDYVGRA